MHATHAIDPNDSTGTTQQPLVERDEPDLEAFLWNVTRLDGVQTDPKPDAHCCGAFGCHLTEYLGKSASRASGRASCARSTFSTSLTGRWASMDDTVLQGSEALSDALCAREREVLATVVPDGGHAKQKDVVEALEIGRDHVARHIDSLADAGHPRKVSLGRENVFFLPGCEPGILQPSLEGAR